MTGIFKSGEAGSYGLLALLAIALVIAAATDVRRRQIDNGLNAAIALAAPLYWWAAGLDAHAILIQLAVAAGTLGLLWLLFAFGLMGGGDVKLLTALALWVRPPLFFKLVVVMAFLGGALSLVIAAWQLARRRRGRMSVPYGVAISGAALWVLAGDIFFAGSAGPLLG